MTYGGNEVAEKILPSGEFFLSFSLLFLSYSSFADEKSRMEERESERRKREREKKEVRKKERWKSRCSNESFLFEKAYF